MIELDSPCKVNLVLNILGQRSDGFHELETLMLPIPLYDRIRIQEGGPGIQLTCSDRSLPGDASNLVHKAAKAFFIRTALQEHVNIHLEKKIPMAAGLGGGSGNAALTLLGLNQLFGKPLNQESLHDLAATLGSDVPFFLQNGPALAFGRGECVEPLAPFQCLHHCGLVLVHPGFGISTPWAYQQLKQFPSMRNGQPGKARRLAEALSLGAVPALSQQLYNSLESPALQKYPILQVYQEYFREQGALGTLMSGSGSTTFAIFKSIELAQSAESVFRSRFSSVWTTSLAL